MPSCLKKTTKIKNEEEGGIQIFVISKSCDFSGEISEISPS